MEKSKDRARANDKPPNLKSPLALLKKLLSIENDRLETAIKIEKKRDIVFPETTVIIHDIMKLSKEIENRDKGKIEKIGMDELENINIDEWIDKNM